MNKNYDQRKSYAVRIVLALVFLILFIIEFWMMKNGMLEKADEDIGEWARSLRGPVQNVILITITHMARWTTLVGIGAVLLIIDAVRWKKWDYPIAIAGCLVTLKIYTTLKKTIQRPRPDELNWLITEHGYSFPSGHTMNGAFCYGMILYLILRNSENEALKKAASIFIPILVLLIGFSRIYCGVHYFSDVLGGFLIGTSLLLFITVLTDELLLRLNEKKQN